MKNRDENRLPRCDYSGIERISCDCPRCESFTMTPAEQRLRRGEVLTIGQLERAAGRTMPDYRMRTRTAPPAAGPWQFGQQVTAADVDQHGRHPQVIDCDHPHDTGICTPCWDLLQQALGDVPALVQDLQTAIRKDTRFVQHGHQRGQDPTEDVAPVDFDIGASRALDQLSTALRTPPSVTGLDRGQALIVQSRRMLSAGPKLRITPNIAGLAKDLSKAIEYAHVIIDRPRDVWYFGTCPKPTAPGGEPCGWNLYGERQDDAVACQRPGCGYAAMMDDHYRNSLNARADEKLTVDELVGVLQRNGQTVHRHTITNLVYRHGLPRERQMRLRWVKEAGLSGRYRQELSEVWVHRIGDVQDLLDRMSQREVG